MRSAAQCFVQAALEAEMTETLSAEKGERSEGRLGYRSGYYWRSLITRVGTLELRVPQDRAGRFSTESFERYQRSEKALVGGVIASQAGLIAVAVDGEGRRQVLAVELANRESRSSWRDFLLGLRQRGLFGVEFVVSDDHAGLKAAIREVLPEAVWQRCYVHFLRTALDYVPRRSMTIAFASFAGFTTAASFRRCAATLPRGF